MQVRECAKEYEKEYLPELQRRQKVGAPPKVYIYIPVMLLALRYGQWQQRQKTEQPHSLLGHAGKTGRGAPEAAGKHGKADNGFATAETSRCRWIGSLTVHVPVLPCIAMFNQYIAGCGAFCKYWKMLSSLHVCLHCNAADVLFGSSC